MQRIRTGFVFAVVICATPVGAMDCIRMDEVAATAAAGGVTFSPASYDSGTKMKLWTWVFQPQADNTTLDNPSLGASSQCGGSSSTAVVHQSASGLYGQISGSGAKKVVFKICNFLGPGNLSGDVARQQFTGDLTTVSGLSLTGSFGEPVEANAAPVGNGHEITLSGDSVTGFIVAAQELDIAEICIEE